jgi:general secretion pathway protein H
MNEKGYTLIEITVVLVLVGIMLGIAIPKVRDVLSSDRLNKTARLLIGMSRELRNDAVREQVDYELHVDLERQRFWKYSADTAAEKRDEVKRRAMTLPDGILIKDIQIYGEGKKTKGETVIRFFKKGYMQPAVVHLAFEGRSMTLLFNPFIANVKTYNDYVDLWKETRTALSFR